MNIISKFKPFTLFLATLLLTGCVTHKKHTTEPASSGYVQVEHGKLFYVKYGSADPSAGDPILILHGGPGLDRTYLLPQMLELAKDHELIFYDQRGSGQSLDAELGSKYVNLEQFTKDLEVLRVQLGLKKFILMGHSWGGYLAMNYAINYPSHVSKLILLTPAPADYKGYQAFETELMKRAEQEPVKTKIAPFLKPEEMQKLDAKEIEDVYRDLFSLYLADPKNAKYITLERDTKSAISGYMIEIEMAKTSWPKYSPSLFPHLSKLSVPTLIIHGYDDVVPYSTAEEIKNAMPNAKLVLLKNCGHVPFIEQPKEMFGAIRGFLMEEK